MPPLDRCGRAPLIPFNSNRIRVLRKAQASVIGLIFSSIRVAPIFDRASLPHPSSRPFPPSPLHPPGAIGWNRCSRSASRLRQLPRSFLLLDVDVFRCVFGRLHLLLPARLLNLLELDPTDFVLRDLRRGFCSSLSPLQSHQTDHAFQRGPVGELRHQVCGIGGPMNFGQSDPLLPHRLLEPQRLCIQMS